MSNINWVEVDYQEYQAKYGPVTLYAGINGGGNAYWSLGSVGQGRQSPIPQSGITDPMAYAAACIRNMQAEAEVAARKWMQG